MISLLKKYFIPHGDNEHKPHVLRKQATLFIATFVLLFGIIFLLQTFIVFPKTNFLAAVFPNVVVDLTNSNRGSAGLSTLQINSLLEKAAQQKAQDMAQKGYFDHTSPEGKTPWYWLDKAGYRYSYAGENIAIHFYDSQDLVKSWMNSSSHRTNILNKNFTEIGIGVATGLYKGKETVYIVQLFGKPTAALAKTTELKTEQATPIEIIPEIKEILSREISSDMFYAKEASIETTLPKTTTTIQAHEEPTINQPVFQSSLAQRLSSSPRVILKYLYFFLFIIIILALVLNIFIKIRIQHPPLIINGLLLLFLITAVFLINNYFMISQSQIL
ncbi:CAP domain-containing protein [Patescibacteria group bacterium]|nr:CAP domain-containing protein [Patescibacteria group bacterium]